MTTGLPPDQGGLSWNLAHLMGIDYYLTYYRGFAITWEDLRKYNVCTLAKGKAEDCTGWTQFNTIQDCKAWIDNSSSADPLPPSAPPPSPPGKSEPDYTITILVIVLLIIGYMLVKK